MLKVQNVEKEELWPRIEELGIKLIADRATGKLLGAQAVGEMIANTPVVTANASRLPEVLARCQQISLATPSFWLHFLKDDSFWTVIDGV